MTAAAGLSRTLFPPTDGVGGSAILGIPVGLTVGGAGNLFVTSLIDHRVRKITSAGRVTTIAGGLAGSGDGQGTQAQFRAPRGVTADAAGNLYVADTDNHTIRRITPSGDVSTFAGVAGMPGNDNGPRGQSRFRSPAGVAIDAQGNLYIADRDNHVIRRIDSSGNVTTLAGLMGTPGSDNGIGDAARFNQPLGVVVNGAGVVFVTDSFNAMVRAVQPNGEVSTVAGSNNRRFHRDGDAATASFASPVGIATDLSGNLYVTDFTLVRRISPAGQTVIAGLIPDSVARDGTGAAARFLRPQGLAADNVGNVYIADSFNQAIRRMSPFGEVSTFAGKFGSAGHVNQPGGDARFNQPSDVAFDSTGTLYVADTQNHVIRKITPAGEVSTFAGAR